MEMHAAQRWGRSMPWGSHPMCSNRCVHAGSVCACMYVCTPVRAHVRAHARASVCPRTPDPPPHLFPCISPLCCATLPKVANCRTLHPHFSTLLCFYTDTCHGLWDFGSYSVCVRVCTCACVCVSARVWGVA